MAKKDRPVDLAESGQENAGDPSECVVTRDSATRGPSGSSPHDSEIHQVQYTGSLARCPDFDDLHLDRKRLRSTASYAMSGFVDMEPDRQRITRARRTMANVGVSEASTVQDVSELSECVAVSLSLKLQHSTVVAISRATDAPT